MFNLKQDVINNALTTAGYDDAQFDDVVSARRSDGGEWEVILDRGGQLKVTLTRRDGRPDDRRVDVLGRKASLLTEKTRVTTVLFKLTDAGELGAALAAIDAALND